MNFELDEQQLSIQKMVRDFTQKEVAPGILERDATATYDRSLYEQMSKMGLIGLPYAKEFGGQGLGYLEYAIAVEEISKVDASLSVSYSVSTSLYGGSLYFSEATEAQRKRFMPPVLHDGHFGSFGLTEPGAGSDVSNLQTFAQKDGDSYIINGNKCFITNGPLSDYYAVYAVTDREVGAKSMACFVVERETPGFSIGARHDTMGIRSAMVSELVFTDCRIPAENMITPPGLGFPAALKTLDGGRIGIASQALGIAEGAFEIARQYLMERKQFGKPLYKNQYLAFKMVDLATEIEQAKYLVYKAAIEKDAHRPFSVAAAKAKLVAADCAMRVTTEAAQMLGGNGFMKGYHVERMMRDAKITQIYEGTSEIQRIVIGKELFKA
ncbi:MAG: acyl-CoA dehydrogenase family protein [Evtepia sp.]